MDGSQADHRETLALAEGTEPASTVENSPAPKSLKQRMAAIRDECDAIHKDNIQKEKDGKKWTERGHTVEVVLSEFRPLLAKYGVEMTPNLVERTYAGNRCDVIVDWEFERTDDSDEKRVIRWAGSDTDNGGKGFAKAGTNALKEMIKKKFLVTDRDDAKEETESVEHQTDDGVKRQDLANAREERRAAIQQWAGTFKAALETAPTTKDVDRLKRENSTQLDSEDLPKVTRTFFLELIAERKAELGE